jgi:putative serine protease PepD
VYDQISPAVVNIDVRARGLDPFGRPVLQEGTGSGFIIDKQGHVVTNEHIIAQADRLDVTLSDGSTYIADVVAEDAATDLALLRIQAPAEKLARLSVAPLGDSTDLDVGHFVVAIGNPFGLERSASLGIVSSLGRSRPGLARRLITDMIQTDAAINPGNSGGPLINLQGQVVGINEQIEAPTRGNVGVGFAIPVNTLKRYLPELMAGRQPQHAWLGLGGVPVGPTLAEQFNLPVQEGVLVTAVVPGSPVAGAGLRGVTGNNPATADIITALDDRSVRSFDDIAEHINARNPGDTVRVTIVRGGQSQTLDVTLGTWQPTEAQVR